MKPLLGPVTEARRYDAEATRASYEAAREGDRGREFRDNVAAALAHLGDHPAAHDLNKAIERYDERGRG